jgi:putative membrane protein insertion efficiency factor
MSVPTDPVLDPVDEHRDDASARPRLLVRLVEWYQRAYQGRPSPCRFSPSCSAYAHEALIVHGAWRGLYLAVRRLARCRPFGPSGFDPVPEATASAVRRIDP